MVYLKNSWFDNKVTCMGRMNIILKMLNIPKISCHFISGMNEIYQSGVRIL